METIINLSAATIAIPVVLVVVIGFIGAAVLSFASKVFAVPVDETAVAIREQLPGANCGGCGFAGCDDYAAALSADRSIGCNKCPVGGADVAAALAELLGMDAGSGDREVAVVMCNGTNDAAKKILEYNGIQSCKAAKSIFGGMNACPYGCLGLGDCAAACKFDAIHVHDGVAWVDRAQCTSCGACVKACPNGLIRIAPEKNLVFVRCSSHANGRESMLSCKNACIGCKKCEKICKFDAVHVENNLAYIDPAKCKNCGMCEKECPTGNILNMRLVKKAAEKKAAEKLNPAAQASAAPLAQPENRA